MFTAFPFHKMLELREEGIAKFYERKGVVARRIWGN